MYQEVSDTLTNSGRAYARGELAAAGLWARKASDYTYIEGKAHQRFMQESAASYVGKRVGLAVIGFFEGAAEAMVGLIDTGAGLIGYHPDLEGKIAARYSKIKDAYSASTGIDHNLTHDAAIGQFLAGSGRPSRPARRSANSARPTACSERPAYSSTPHRPRRE